MRIRKLSTRIMAILVMLTLLVPAGFTANTQTVQASSAEAFDSLHKLFPAGMILRSDMFPGIKILFDGQETYQVKDGANIVTLSIIVEDPERLAESLPALRFLFGPITVDKVNGFPAEQIKISGIQPVIYSALIESTGNPELKKLFEQLMSGDNPEFTSASLNEIFTFMAASGVSAQIAAENAAIGGDTQAPENYSSERVIMIFLNGSNLESRGNSATRTLLGLLRANIPSNTRVFITTGGTKTWHMNDRDAYYDYARELLYPGKYDYQLSDDQKAQVKGKADDLFSKYATDISNSIQIYEVNKAGELAYNTLALKETIEGRYMVEHAYLTDFINYVTDNTDAKMYDLIMWDHGGGIGGFGVDELYNSDVEDKKIEKRSDVNFTDIGLISTAIANSKLVKNGRKLDFLGFDACVMGALEVAMNLTNVADYLVVSEDNEYGDGWDFNGFMNALGNQPQMETTVLCTNIVDSFLKLHGNMKETNTLSVIDTKKIDAVDKALTEFATYLVRDYLTDEYHDEILISIGKEGDFGVKAGPTNEGLLDLGGLCQIFVEDDVYDWSPELIESSKKLSSAIKDAVVVAKDTNGNIYSGLSINFPLEVRGKSFYGIDEKGATVFGYYSRSADAINNYNKINVNSDYKKAYARIALNKMAAIVIGDNWLYEYSFDIDQVFEELKKKGEDSYGASPLYEAAGCNLDDPSDEVRKSIVKLFNDRVKISNVEITYLPEEGQASEQADDAKITIKDTNPLIIDDDMYVDVVLTVKEDGKERRIPLGTTPFYTTNSGYDSKDNEKVIQIKRFDNKWFVINEQIADLTFKDYASDQYSGYIQLGWWYSSEDVAGSAEDESRDKYVNSKISSRAADIIYLNVEGQLKDGEIISVNPVSYSYTNEDGSQSKGGNSIADLTNYYFEILCGKDEGIYSLGTIYAKEPENDTEDIFKIEKAEIKDLTPYYYLSDYYGNRYEFTDSTLDDTEYENYSLEGFKYENTDAALTFEDSQKQAEKIRKQAADEKKSDEGDSKGEDNPDSEDEDNSEDEEEQEP